jgi:hypothetical protein
MGCKCASDLFFGESEIIKANSIQQTKSNKTTYEKPLSNSSKYISQKNNDSNIKPPEINIIQKPNEETASILNSNKSQISSQVSLYNYSEKEQPVTPVKSVLDFSEEYTERIISLINNIRSDPSSYSYTILESIQNIKRTKNDKIIYHDKVKVALFKGEEAFYDAAEKLKNIQPMNKLEYDQNLCVPLPENENEFKSQEFLNSSVEKMREKNINVEIYFRDFIKIPEVAVLLMIVDDNSKNTSKKRNTLLNKNFKYIGVCSKFIGKNFVAHLSFSR